MRIEMLNKKIKIKISILILIIIGIVVFGINFAPWVIEKLKQPETLREYLRSFGGLGFLIYVLLQAAHVLILVIPGDLFTICGGFIYGISVGFILSVIGIMLGTVCAFYISRFLGYEFISKIIPKSKIDKISNALNSTEGTIGMLIICLMPFIPKDLMMYIAGITPIRASKLFFIYAISRIPATLFWTSVGSQAYNRDSKGIIVILVVMVLLIISGIILKNMYKKSQSKENSIVSSKINF